MSWMRMGLPKNEGGLSIWDPILLARVLIVCSALQIWLDDYLIWLNWMRLKDVCGAALGDLLLCHNQSRFEIDNEGEEFN